jgi:trans-aconitate methyltransferase
LALKPLLATLRSSDYGAYDPRAEAGGVLRETSRMETQAALSWREEQAILARLVPRPDLSLLEVGSGTGAFTTRLLAAWPQARITALEPDPELLALARQRIVAAADALAPQWVAGSIECNNLPDGAYDLVVVRYVLQHLADPVTAIHRLLPKLAPHGRIVAIDVDGALWGAAEPTDPALAALHAAGADQNANTHADGQAGPRTNRLVGRRLWHILRDAGCADCRLEVFAYHSGDFGLAAFESQLNPERLLRSVASGQLPFESCKPEPPNMRCTTYSAICRVQEYAELQAWEPCADGHVGSHRSAYSSAPQRGDQFVWRPEPSFF